MRCTPNLRMKADYGRSKTQTALLLNLLHVVSNTQQFCSIFLLDALSVRLDAVPDELARFTSVCARCYHFSSF